MESVFLELEFLLLILFSLVLPAGIYATLFWKTTISRPAVLLFAVSLVLLAGVDLYLLSVLGEMARLTVSAADDRLFNGELRIALYLLPALFAGTGINLVSHVLIHHLSRAEQRFEHEKD